MRVTVKLFAVLREKAGADEFSLELPAGSDVAAAREAVVAKLPAVKGMIERAAFAVNREYAALSTELKDGDELAVIPPVSGG
jgi:molybdopterin synthase catalytic subunit